jgi:hypothetical protein
MKKLEFSSEEARSFHQKKQEVSIRRRISIKKKEDLPVSCQEYMGQCTKEVFADCRRIPV